MGDGSLSTGLGRTGHTDRMVVDGAYPDFLIWSGQSGGQILVGITGRLPIAEGPHLGIDSCLVIDYAVDLLPISTALTYLLHSL